MATTEHEPVTDDAPGTDLAHVQAPADGWHNPIRAGLAVRNMDDLATMATAVSRARMFKDVDTPERAATKMLVAMAMGFDPMAGLTGIDIIDGNPSPNGHFWAAAIESHPRYDYVVRESTSERCTLEFLRDGEFRGAVTWTMEDAERAGLHGKDNWKKYPRPMLYNRAMTEGVRMFCPQLLGGLRAYSAEELEGISPATSERWGGTRLGEAPPEVREIREYAGKDGTRGWAVKFENLSRETKRDVEQALRKHLAAEYHSGKGVWLVAHGRGPALAGPHPDGGETFAEAFGFNVHHLADVEADEVIEHDEVIDVPAETSTTAEEASDATAPGKPGMDAAGVEQASASSEPEPSPTPPPATPVEPETNLLGEPVATTDALAPAPAGGAPGDLPPLANIEAQYGLGDTDDAGAASRWYALKALVEEQADGTPDAFTDFLDALGVFTHEALGLAVNWRAALANLGYNPGQ